MQPLLIKLRRHLWQISLTLLALCLLAEALIQLHAPFGTDQLFGFHAWFGFFSCAVLVMIAKLLGFLLKRPEHYYDK